MVRYAGGTLPIISNNTHHRSLPRLTLGFLCFCRASLSPSPAVLTSSVQRCGDPKRWNDAYSRKLSNMLMTAAQTNFARQILTRQMIRSRVPWPHHSPCPPD